MPSSPLPFRAKALRYGMEFDMRGSPGFQRALPGLLARSSSLVAATAIILLLVLLVLGGPRLARDGIPYPPERSWLDG